MKCSSMTAVGDDPVEMCIRDRNRRELRLFLISKSITSCTGSQVKEVNEIAVNLMVKTQSDDQTTRLLTLKLIGDFDVEVIPHRILNAQKAWGSEEMCSVILRTRKSQNCHPRAS